MKRNKKFLIAIGLFLLMSICAIGQRGPGPIQDQQYGHRPLMGIPDLTEEQMDQIKDLQIAHLKETRTLKNDIKINNATLEAMQTEDNPDMDKMIELIERNGKLLTELRKKQLAHEMEIRNLLTDDQKVFFDNRMQRTRYNAGAGFGGNRMAPGRGYGYQQGRAGFQRGYGYNRGYCWRYW